MLGLRTQDPSAVKDYSIDWSAWLDGDTIETSTWVIPSGLTEADTAIATTTATTVWLSGGTLGQTYTVTNQVVTAGGRTDHRSFQLRIEDQ